MARPKYPSDEADKTMVRFPAGLMPRIKDAAQKNNRSMNAEIVATLEQAYPAAAPLVELIEAVTSIVERRQRGTLSPAEWLRLPNNVRRLVVQFELYGTRNTAQGEHHPRHGRAFAEGRNAFKQKASMDTNPYDPDEPKYDVWCEGYDYERMATELEYYDIPPHTGE